MNVGGQYINYVDGLHVPPEYVTGSNARASEDNLTRAEISAVLSGRRLSDYFSPERVAALGGDRYIFSGWQLQWEVSLAPEFLQTPRDTLQQKVDTAIKDARTYLAKSNCANLLNYLAKLAGSKSNNAATPTDMLNKVDGKVFFVATGPTDRMVAHSVMSDNDAYNTPTKTFSAGDTILVSHYFVDPNTASGVFDQVDPAKESISDRDARAVLLIHELLHLYSGEGHGAEPASWDHRWNDYIYWVCLKDQQVAGVKL